MGEFIYCTSLDHAKWFIDPESPCVEFTTKELDEHDGKRFAIKNWIESNCAGKVWMWNGVSSPSAGSMNWSNKIVPQVVVTFILKMTKIAYYFPDGRAHV